MAAVDWTKLPKDLLNLISQRIYDEVDLIRFQSVCSTWRSSSVPNHHPISPFKFPLLKFPFLSDSNDIDTINSNNNTSFCYLTKQNLYLIQPPQQQQEEQRLLRPWLVGVGQNTHGQTKYINPVMQNCSFVVHSVIDHNKLSVLHLGSTYFIMDIDVKINRQLIISKEYMYPKKVVAVTCHGKKPLVVGMLAFPPYPLLLKCGDEDWKVIPDMSMKFEDICVFKGRPYAIDEIGKTIMIGPDSSVHLVAEPLVGGGNMKFLVESEGDLLLADVYDCLCIDLNDPVRIDLFKLNEKEKKWVKLTSLGDRVLFLGLGLVYSFSVSASDLCVSQGNCIIFESMSSERELYVLDLDDGQLSLFYDNPEYSNLLWLPRTWIRARYQDMSSLQELEKICECVRVSGKHVLLVFYDVDPSEVRKQSGIYCEAFAKHEQRFK
ncbi:TIR domain protein [Medicago truncatula]|uniref:TIR domain protein n=1 Tax=Medicago truncatula TaxID=3880 RepID=G7KPJ8_MEDTR|nr:TIR domain protein [Medicago truncatula]